MTETTPSSPRWLMAAVVVGIVSIVIVAAAFPSIVAPLEIRPTPTVEQTVPSPMPPFGSYQPEILPPLTYTPPPTRTPTPTLTNTPLPTRTPFILPTIAFDSPLLLLPDVTVTGISDPMCVPDRKGTILELNIFIRNIGRAGTRYFGSFQVDVFLLMGQQRYGLDEWAQKFNGVIGTSNMEISSLDANADVKLTVVLDLKGNKDFGIEVLVNSGDDPMREEDMTNNSLTKYFSAKCY